MATIPSLAGWTAGERPTAAKLTEHTKTSIDFLVNVPLCQLRHSTVQSIPNGAVYTTLTLGSIDFDNDSMADTANNRIVIQTAGKYLVTASVSYTSNATGVRGAFVAVNGSGTPDLGQSVQAANGFATIVQTFGFINLAVNDNLIARAMQTSGAALNTAAASTKAFSIMLSARWAGA